MKLGLIALIALSSIASVVKAASASDYIERLLHIEHENINEAQQELLNRINEAKASDELCANEENPMLCTVDSLVKNIGVELESYGIPNTAEEIDVAKFDEILSRMLGVADPSVFAKYEAYVESISAESIPHDELLTASDDNLFTKIADEMNSAMKDVPDMKLSKIVAPFLIKDPENKSGAISSLMETMSLDQDAIANDDMFKDIREAIAKKIVDSTEKGDDQVVLDLTLESLLDLDVKKSGEEASSESEDKAEESLVDADQEDIEALADADAIEAETTGGEVDEASEEVDEEADEEEDNEQAVAFLDSNEVAPTAAEASTVDEKALAMRAVLRITLGELLNGLFGTVNDLTKILEGINIGANISVGTPTNINAGVSVGVKPNSGVNVGVGSAPAAGVNIGVGSSTGPKTGANSGINVGINPGVNVGVNPGVNVGVNPGVNVGVNPGVSVGVNPDLNINLGI